MKWNHNETLEQIYNRLCREPCDINEHLPVLCRYAEQCDSVVEMGVRDAVSTWAFLMGLKKRKQAQLQRYQEEYKQQLETSSLTTDNVSSSQLVRDEQTSIPSVYHPPVKRLLSIDLYKSSEIEHVAEIAAKEGIEFTFIEKNDLYVELTEPWDLLFIDSWHIGGQLKRELETHSSNITTFILLHDVAIDGIHGESLRVMRSPHIPWIEPSKLRDMVLEQTEEQCQSVANVNQELFAKLPLDFNWFRYLLVNPDLYPNGVQSKLDAIMHYLYHGIYENRNYGPEIRLSTDPEDDTDKSWNLETWSITKQSRLSGIPQNEITIGLQWAISNFVQKTDSEWKIKKQLLNNNGLGILIRKRSLRNVSSSSDEVSVYSKNVLPIIIKKEKTDPEVVQDNEDHSISPDIVFVSLEQKLKESSIVLPDPSKSIILDAPKSIILDAPSITNVQEESKGESLQSEKITSTSTDQYNDEPVVTCLENGYQPHQQQETKRELNDDETINTANVIIEPSSLSSTAVNKSQSLPKKKKPQKNYARGKRW